MVSCPQTLAPGGAPAWIVYHIVTTSEDYFRAPGSLRRAHMPELRRFSK